MAIYGFSITKRVSFRGVQQEFSNVYHYNFASIIGGADADDAIDDLTTHEKLLHSADVTFVLGRCWSAGQTAGQNQMLTEKALSGTGSLTANVVMDRERAFLVQWPAGFNSRGRPVFLRKWYHSCGGPASIVVSNGMLQQTVALTTTERNNLAALADNIDTISAGANQGDLCAASGRQKTGGPVAHEWLEHHQLGEAWRG